MDMLSLCRICLSSNKILHSIVNTRLQEVYESLTKMPFVAEDLRPVLACKLCCARLENCYKLKRRCLQSEELFVQLLKNNAQVNLQILPETYLSMEDMLQVTPNVLDCIEVKQENGEGADNDRSISSDPEVHAGTEELIGTDSDVRNVMPNDVAMERNDTDLYHSALGLHTECDLPPDVVKEEPDDVDTGASRLATQQCREDKLPHNLKRTDYTMGKVEEQRREKSDADDVTLKKKMIMELMEAHDKVVIKLRDNKQNDNTPQPTETPKEISEKNISVETEKPYVCNVCNQRYRHKVSLYTHMSIHTDEKPYECIHCKKCFRVQSYLKVHMRRHTGEKPYKCKVCQKCFTDNSSFLRHGRSHTGLKPYQCNICMKRYIQKSDLNSHIRNHTGERPYKCNACKKCYMDRRALSVHIRTNRHKTQVVLLGGEEEPIIEYNKSIVG